MKEQARPEALMRARIMGVKEPTCANCTFFIHEDDGQWCRLHMHSPLRRFDTIEYICKDYEPKARTSRG